MTASPTLIRIETELDARPFYGRRVWIVLDGERLRRTIEADALPAGDGRTMGEYHDRVLVRALKSCHAIGLRYAELFVEVDA
jgi:hypothetical protein